MAFWSCNRKCLELAAVQVAGIVNVTPDSFSDGGRYALPEEAFSRARNCVRAGARIVDLGGESTRPDATPIAWQEEWARIEGVIELSRDRVIELSHAGRGDVPVIVSVDTYHAETAERALAAGADAINCVYAPSAEMWRVLENSACGVILPAEVADAAFARLAAERIVLDPMIGFGTTREEDLARLRGIAGLAQKAPVCVGVSRKRLIRKLTGEKATGKNLGGSVGAAVWCALHGAKILRVHDVKETVQAVRVAAAFEGKAGET